MKGVHDGKLRLGQSIIGVTTTLFVIAVTLIILFRAIYPHVYQPVHIGTLDKAPESIVLHDQRILTQTIQSSVAPVTHMGVYTTGPIADYLESSLLISVKDEQGSVIHDSREDISALIKNDYTLIEMDRVLKPNIPYEVTLQTEGVPLSDRFAVGYEPQASELFTKTQIALKKDGATPALKNGHYALVGVTKSTPQLFLYFLLRSHLLQVSLVGFTVFWIVSLWFSRALGTYFEEPTAIKYRTKPSFRELVTATGIALMISLFVIFPYFQTPNAINPTLRDAHRALIYLGIARDAILDEGELGLWDPYTCGGIPLLANAESSHTGPLFPLVLVFGEQVGLRLSLLATLVIGFMGTYVLARQAMGSNKIFALLAGSIFVFSSFQMVALSRAYYAWLPMAFIPWVYVYAIRGLTSLWATVATAGIVAFIFLGGSMHMLTYALIGLWTLLLGYALVLRSFKPLLLATVITMLAIPFASIKLLPSTELQSVATLERNTEFVPPLSWLPRLFLDRDELSHPTYFMSNGDRVAVRQFMSYLGIVPLFIFIISLPILRTKKYLPVVLTLILSFLLMFGLPPNNLVEATPVLKEILREPIRANILFILAFGILIAGSGTELSKKLSIPNQRLQVMSIALVSVAIIDLVTAHHGLHKTVFTHPVVSLEKRDAFVRSEHAYSTPNDEYYTAGYINYVANQGMTDICPVYLHDNPHAAQGFNSANDQRPYMGEVYFSNKGGVEQYKVHTNSVTANVALEETGYLIINQNFYPGWHVSGDREVINYHGLIATEASTNDEVITFFYRPTSFVVGASITAITLGLIGFLWYYAHKQKT